MKTSAVTILPLALLAGEMFFHPIEQLRAVHALSPWAAMPFWHAMARPVIAAALKLGAAVYAAPPPPLDAKRLAAGERHE